jgi:hypothetical protein
MIAEYFLLNHLPLISKQQDISFRKHTSECKACAALSVVFGFSNVAILT